MHQVVKKTMSYTKMIAKFTLKIGVVLMKANLIVFKVLGFDDILGMNWHLSIFQVLTVEK